MIIVARRASAIVVASLGRAVAGPARAQQASTDTRAQLETATLPAPKPETVLVATPVAPVSIAEADAHATDLVDGVNYFAAGHNARPQPQLARRTYSVRAIDPVTSLILNVQTS